MPDPIITLPSAPIVLFEEYFDPKANDFLVIVDIATGKTKKIKAQYFGQAAPSTSYKWVSSFDYPEDAIVEHNGKWYLSLQTPNLGHAPGASGSEAFWELQTKSPTGFVYWQPGVFTGDPVLVLYEITPGNIQIYQLINPTRPFLSSDFETELGAGDWQVISEGQTHFKGVFASEAALESAYPDAEPGDYALVDTGGADAQLFVWDETDADWIASGVTTIITGSNGVQVVGADVRLGGTPITAATVLEITSGSLAVTGTDKAFTLKSTSGFQPKLRIEGDGANTDGRNYEFEPQLISGFIRGLLLKYSTAHNTAANQPAIFVRDNGWIYFGATSENTVHMIYRPNKSLAIGNNIQQANDNDFIKGDNITNLSSQGRNIITGQNFNLKGASIANLIYADGPDNGADSMNNLSACIIWGIDSTVSVQELASSILFGDDYDVNQPLAGPVAPEFQGLYNILMGNHNVMRNSHHLFQFGTGLDNQYTNASHGNWKFQPKFVFGNANVPMGAERAIFVIANGFRGSFKSQSLTHLANGWTQINTTNTKGMEGGGTDVDLSASDVTPKGALEIVSTTAGFIPPKMTTTQRNAISSPPDGSMVYDTTLGEYYVRRAGAWTPLSVGTSFSAATQAEAITGTDNTKTITPLSLEQKRSVASKTISNSATGTITIDCEGKQEVKVILTTTITGAVTITPSNDSSLEILHISCAVTGSGIDFTWPSTTRMAQAFEVATGNGWYQSTKILKISSINSADMWQFSMVKVSTSPKFMLEYDGPARS